MTTLLGGLLAVGSSAYASTPVSNLVFINGMMEDSAITIQGRTFVQLRALDDPEWLTYTYDAKSRTIFARSKDNSRVVQLKAGEKVAIVDGKKTTLDAAVIIKDGHTYVPLRFISESLNAYVTYNDADKRVIIRTPAGQKAYKKLMSGDLTEARTIAIRLSRVYAKDALTPQGEGFTTDYTFPEGQAMRFMVDYKSLTNYVEINEDGLAEVKWQKDAFEFPQIMEKGTKPVDFGNQVFFTDSLMNDLLIYGKIDASGKEMELGRIDRDQQSQYKNIVIVPIEGEVRTDEKK
ncbi:copper amine oxidase N-terminal domain-containing protein [Paenibacillus selenitireducens]|uniref:copper amine oxidase N-terminal domain-containing protein n=1 Tax=Paenibacillus selenitireducens TaxID=1324314 RepID=UPI001E3CF3EC|nr:copper amine oxidase N-terminal domain-containing protein [Paenibacillus selenitireducens]